MKRGVIRRLFPQDRSPRTMSSSFGLISCAVFCIVFIMSPVGIMAVNQNTSVTMWSCITPTETACVVQTDGSTLLEQSHHTIVLRNDITLDKNLDIFKGQHGIVIDGQGHTLNGDGQYHIYIGDDSAYQATYSSYLSSSASELGLDITIKNLIMSTFGGTNYMELPSSLKSISEANMAGTFPSLSNRLPQNL